ncbi:hypothetical protein [Phenylobacterium sp.]|nr:hypothetical protein [Phenylobacterium sp.]
MDHLALPGEREVGAGQLAGADIFFLQEAVDLRQPLGGKAQGFGAGI